MGGTEGLTSGAPAAEDHAPVVPGRRADDMSVLVPGLIGAAGVTGAALAVFTMSTWRSTGDVVETIEFLFLALCFLASLVAGAIAIGLGL